jgi:hypothetical protein
MYLRRVGWELVALHRESDWRGLYRFALRQGIDERLQHVVLGRHALRITLFGGLAWGM